MKKIFLAAMPWIFAAIGYKATAQDVKKDDKKKETQVITIRKKGEKDTKLVVEFKNDKVIINGKPLVEFKDDEITVNNKKIMVREGSNFKLYGDHGDEMVMNWEGFGEDFARGFGGMESGTFLGVTTQDDDTGARITDVVKESAAEKAGLQEGDIITRVGDTKIANPADLSEAISSKKAKEEVKITYKRDGKEKTTKATLGERKATRTFSFSGPNGKLRSFAVPGTPAVPKVPGVPMTPHSFNFDHDFDFSPDIHVFGRPRLGLKIQDLEEGSGVKVLDVEEGSAAEKAGLKKDDVIVAVGDAKVNNTDEAREQLAKNAEKSNYSIEAKRNNSNMKFEIKIPKKLKTANL